MSEIAILIITLCVFVIFLRKRIDMVVRARFDHNAEIGRKNGRYMLIETSVRICYLHECEAYPSFWQMLLLFWVDPREMLRDRFIYTQNYEV